jgi:hypothetical protein
MVVSIQKIKKLLCPKREKKTDPTGARSVVPIEKLEKEENISSRKTI